MPVCNEVSYVKMPDGRASGAVYVVLAVTANGEREIVGLWVAKSGGRAAAFWLRRVLRPIGLVIGTLDPAGDRRQRLGRRWRAVLGAYDSTVGGSVPTALFAA